MMEEASVLRVIRGELGKEPRLVPALGTLSLRFHDGVLFMDGEVATVGAKRLALERAAGVWCVQGIVDRLHVSPALRMSDGALARRLGIALARERMFAAYAITCDGRRGRRAGDGHGLIDYRVEDGVVTLRGAVMRLDHKRMAGVLAWWMPGSRDVVNAIAVEPPDDDSDRTMADDLRAVLRKDPLLSAARIRVSVHHCAVRLSGSVASRSESERAESDAWCLFGVERVENTLAVVGLPPARRHSRPTETSPQE